MNECIWVFKKIFVKRQNKYIFTFELGKKIYDILKKKIVNTNYYNIWIFVAKREKDIAGGIKIIPISKTLY